MADKVTAKNSDVKFAPHPTGQFPGKCVDTIDLGECVVDYPGFPKYLATKCALLFRTGEKNVETGEFIDIAAEFTVSMGEKANLRKFLEAWRGKPYTQEEADEGVPVDKLVGHWAYLNVAHKLSKKGRTYAIVQSVMGVPKEVKASLGEFPAYTRQQFWDDKKKTYAEEARKFRAVEGTPPIEAEDESQVDDDSDSDLPF